MIGRVGSVFGEHGVNIVSAAVGRQPDDDDGDDGAQRRDGGHDRRAGPAGGRRRDRRGRRLRRRSRRHALSRRRAASGGMRLTSLPVRRSVAVATRGLRTRFRRCDKCHNVHTPSGQEAHVESAAVSQPVAGGEHAKLKEGALGYVSNLVIGVASTAPGYSLAATLGFIVAVARRRRACAGRAARLVRPDAAVATRLPLHEQGRPGPRHVVRMGAQRHGPALRLAQRLGDHRRRHHRDGGARADRGQVHLPAVRLGLGGRTPTRRRCIVAVGGSS